MVKRIISYKGQTLETIMVNELSVEDFEWLRKKHYEKPKRSEIVNEIANMVSNNGITMTKIEQYYFRELMSRTKVYYNKWSIKDLFDYKPLLDYMYSRTLTNDKVFTGDLHQNIETAIRIGGKGVASKVANFPIKTVDQVLKGLLNNNNYYDMSCGWGARLLSALKNNVNYYGTDPNYLLVDKLNELVSDWKDITKTKPNVDIRPHGSEKFVKEWENIMGLCFTSPPYFYLEDYGVGEQSYKQGTTYQEWLSNYLEPTIKNCHRYLIDKGLLAINIKDFSKYKLEQDTKNISENNGFVFVGVFELENIARVKSTGELGDSNENIMIFAKKGFEQHYNAYKIQPKHYNIFDFMEEE